MRDNKATLDERVIVPDSQRTTAPQIEQDIANHADFRRATLRGALGQGLLSDEQLLAGFVDVSGVESTIAALQNAFPENFRHTFAAKANSLGAALRLVRKAGMGCEVASSGELHIALQSGFDASEIVHDEPAKTEQLLRFLLDNNIAFNIDNFQELARVLRLRKDIPSTATIGFRINPQVGSGSIGAMSTATQTSKFGVALQDKGNRNRIVRAYAEHDWLTSIHTHIGSQGCSIELMVEGIRNVVDLVTSINGNIGHQQIKTIDIGGGLPVNFTDDEVTPTFADYAAALSTAVPELFSGEYTVKTEFGRSVFAKNGFIAARVEYTKVSGGRHIAITHAGAQTATRTAFMPDLWGIRISVFDEHGAPKRTASTVQDVAGPCCFAGDLIAREATLPLIEPGDYVMLHDTGAYYFSNPFFYNNLPPISVYGAGADGSFEVWREQPPLEELLKVMT